MANIIPITCPNCSASLQIESNRQEAFCTYCGAKFLVHNDNEKIMRTIDETEIAKANANKDIELKRMELETEAEMLREKNKNKKLIITFVYLAFLMILALIMTYLQK